MDSIHAAQLQQQLRHNANEVQEFVKELGEWEDEIKQKDESLKKNKPILKQVFFFFFGGLASYLFHFVHNFYVIRDCRLLEDRWEGKVAEFPRRRRPK